MEVIGLYLIAAGLLCVAGMAKAVRPDDTALAMAALVPGRPPLRLVRAVVRVGALAEAALGAVAILLPASGHCRARRALLPRLLRRRGLCPLARRSARHVWVLRPARHPPDRAPPGPRPDAGRGSGRRRRRRPAAEHPRAATGPPALGRPPPALRERGGSLAHRARPLCAGRPHRRPSGVPARPGAGVVSISTRAGRARRQGPGGTPVPAQPDQPLRLRRQRRRRRLRPRPGPQARDGLRGHLSVRQRRLWLRQHLLLGVLRVLLRGQRRQLLPGEHRHGGLVGGGQLVVLRRPALLHGLQCHLLV